MAVISQIDVLSPKVMQLFHKPIQITYAWGGPIPFVSTCVV